MDSATEATTKTNGKPSLLAGYAADAKEELPVGGYAAIMTAFAAGFGALLLGASRRKALPARIATRDIVLLGIATHKLTRIVTLDWVTIPLRFPFTKYEGSKQAGEVDEKARGHGLRRAVGDLLTCPFCTGPWIAAALTATLVAKPRVARTIASVFGIVTISDFLHHAYSRTKKLSA